MCRSPLLHHITCSKSCCSYHCFYCIILTDRQTNSFTFFHIIFQQIILYFHRYCHPTGLNSWTSIFSVSFQGPLETYNGIKLIGIETYRITIYICINVSSPWYCCQNMVLRPPFKTNFTNKISSRYINRRCISRNSNCTCILTIYNLTGSTGYLGLFVLVAPPTIPQSNRVDIGG